MPIRASMEKDNFGFLWITSWCASTDNVVDDWHCSPANSIEASGERALELIEYVMGHDSSAPTSTSLLEQVEDEEAGDEQDKLCGL